MTKANGKSPNHVNFFTSIQRQIVGNKTSEMLEVVKQVKLTSLSLI